LKKGDIASEAELLAEGTGWMPAVFQTEHHTEPEGVPGAASDDDASEGATAEVETRALAA
jgi:ParB family chromosome partitioning protein